VNATARLDVRRLSKRFGVNEALRDASLVLQGGEIHGLVGENGSGKSTLVKLLSGYWPPEPGGEVLVDGEALALPIKPGDMRRHGLSVVHQDLGLVDGFSVAENLRVGDFQVHRLTRAIRWRGEREKTREALAALGQTIDPSAQVEQLSAAQRASVAIARALQHHERGRGVVMFDESSRALPRESLAHFHALVREVADQGGSVLFVSHRLDEVLGLADRVTVLRDGQVVAAGVSRAELTEQELIRLMLGRELATPASRRGRERPSGEIAAQARDLSGSLLDRVELTVGRGEIVGLTGLVGSGYEELPYLLGGARRAAAGTLTIDGACIDLTRSTPRQLSDAGVAIVPERRAEEGLAMELSVQENVTIPRVRTRGSRLLLGASWQRQEADRVVRELGVRPAEPDMLVRQLSGGNQQKVLLGKWLLGEPALLVMHEPTQGVDVGAHREIVEVILRTAGRGCGVVVAGLDAGELAMLCDRVLILRAGRIASEISGARLSFAGIVAAVYSTQTVGIDA
jgi:ribose transport system ATP-binding protein